MRENVCRLHLSFLTFRLFLEEVLRVWGSKQRNKARKKIALHSIEQIQTQSNPACLRVLGF